MYGPRSPDHPRRVDPTVLVERAWQPAGFLDAWIFEKGTWVGRVRGPGNRVSWIPQAELRRQNSSNAQQQGPIIRLQGGPDAKWAYCQDDFLDCAPHRAWAARSATPQGGLWHTNAPPPATPGSGTKDTTATQTRSSDSSVRARISVPAVPTVA